MSETGFIFSQQEYDARLGLPVELQGSISPAAQLARYEALVSDGANPDETMERLGLTAEDFMTEVEF